MRFVPDNTFCFFEMHVKTGLALYYPALLQRMCKHPEIDLQPNIHVRWFIFPSFWLHTRSCC